MSDSQNWRDKYLDALNQQELEQRSAQQTEELLKRLVNRLSMACRGLSDDLDQELEKLGRALKQEASPAALEKALHRLSTAIGRLDDPDSEPSSGPASEPAGSSTAAQDEHGPAMRELLVELLGQLQVAPDARSELRELQLQVESAQGLEQQAVLVSRVVSLVNAQQVGLLREKADLQGIVEQVTAQLDEVAAWLVGHSEHEQAAQASSQELTGHLHREVSALNSTVGSANSLDEIRRRVREQLAKVGRHLDDFRQREEARMSEFQARSETMNARIRELEKEAEQLQASIRREQHRALTDVLSGLPNRLAYRQRLENDLSRWRSERGVGCLAVWDIDHFKAINDTIGHKAGDKAIRCLAQQLSSTCRKSDFVARYGGEEFVMILDGLSAESALKVAEKIRASIEDVDFRHAGKPVRITASCGISEVRMQDDPDSLFERADRALYQAKADGRNRCVLA